jgi:hypothetical protein
MPADPAATPEPTPSADAEDRHVGSRAELLPEEQAVGSDDPAAQAEAILAESQERTEHPDPDISSQSRHASSEEAASRGDSEGDPAGGPASGSEGGAA